MSTIQVRVKEETKKQAKKILDELGMDMSAAVNIFLRQVIVKKGIPFVILTENGFTPEFEDEVLKARNDPWSSPGFDNAKDAIAYLHKVTGHSYKSKKKPHELALPKTIPKSVQKVTTRDAKKSRSRSRTIRP